jgi:hypothetical protein
VGHGAPPWAAVASAGPGSPDQPERRGTRSNERAVSGDVEGGPLAHCRRRRPGHVGPGRRRRTRFAAGSRPIARLGLLVGPRVGLGQAGFSLVQEHVEGAVQVLRPTTSRLRRATSLAEQAGAQPAARRRRPGRDPRPHGPGPAGRSRTIRPAVTSASAGAGQQAADLGRPPSKYRPRSVAGLTARWADRWPGRAGPGQGSGPGGQPWRASKGPPAAPTGSGAGPRPNRAGHPWRRGLRDTLVQPSQLDHLAVVQTRPVEA